MERYNDVYKTRALNIYLRCSGDVGTVIHGLRQREDDWGKPPTSLRVEKWVKQYKWDLMLVELQNVLMADAAKKALFEQRKNLSYIEAIKNKLMRAIDGHPDKHGEPTRTPLKARTLETAANALCKVMETEATLRGVTKDEEAVRREEDGILALLGEAMKHPKQIEGEVVEPDIEATNPDPTADTADGEGIVN